MKEGRLHAAVSMEEGREQPAEENCQRHIQEKSGHTRRRESRHAFPARPGLSSDESRPPEQARSQPEQPNQQRRSRPCQQGNPCQIVRTRMLYTKRPNRHVRKEDDSRYLAMLKCDERADQKCRPRKRDG